MLLQYADDLFVCETVALHPLVLSNEPELTSKWIISTGQGHTYFRYEGAGLEMIYNPTTGQVGHIQPLR
ncbi:hypothetical protein ELG85_01135 [Rhizobium leguminosarum]|nr:hypothetical protein ELG85_01135 [Rhizobium leguminosarum]